MCVAADFRRQPSDCQTAPATFSLWPSMQATTHMRCSRGRSVSSSALRLRKFERAETSSNSRWCSPSRSTAPLEIESPRFEDLDVLLVAGLNRRYGGLEDSAGVPGQWQQFGVEQAQIRGRVGPSAYGVCFNLDDEGSMDYLSGIQVAGFGAQGSQFACLRIPRRRYAVFVHRQHIAGIRRTWDAIWNGWLPRSGHEVADAPLLERYDDHLHPQSGRGGFSLLVPSS